MERLVTPSHRLEQIREWRKNNRDHSRKYRLANKERISRLQREWNVKNREKLRIQAAERRAKNPEYARQKARNWCRRHYDKVRHQQLMIKFGISLDQYNEMAEKQGFKCSICLKHQSEMTRKLAVDHCHKTKRVRGLLCDPCNRGIALLKELPENMMRAIEHLKTPAHP